METLQKLRLNRRSTRPAKNDGKTITQPNLGQTVAEIIDKIQRGQSVPQSMPLFFGDKLPELIGFENMSKLEQIEYARDFKDYAKRVYQEAEAEANRLNAEALKQKAVDAVNQP